MSDRESADKQSIVNIIAECSDLSEAVGVSIGMASMCWENIEGAGEFNSTRAGWIVDALYEHIQMNRSFTGTRD